MRQAAAPIVCYSGKTERRAKSSLSLAHAHVACCHVSRPASWLRLYSVVFTSNSMGLVRGIRVVSYNELLPVLLRSRSRFTKSAGPKDKRGFDLISDVLPFGRLWYDTPDHAIGYAMHSSRSHDAVIRVYDDAGNVIATREYTGDLPLL